MWLCFATLFNSCAYVVQSSEPEQNAKERDTQSSLPKELMTWQRDRPVMKQPLYCEGHWGDSQEDTKIKCTEGLGQQERQPGG